MTSTNVLSRRILTLGFGSAMLAGAAAAQQAYPSKPIRLIVPYTTGAITDLLARLVGAELTKAWGQQVVVDNRPGGNTMIGTDALVKSPADGYTLLLVTASHVILDPQASLPYDPIGNFAPVATIASNEFLMVLHPSVPANTLPEFIALAKAQPGKLNYASAGGGSASHLAGALFNTLAGVDIQHVPYKGGAPALFDLLGGHVQMSYQSPIAVLNYVKEGKLKAIGFGNDTRLPALPDVPTFAEAGVPDYQLKIWFGILAPAGTPGPIVDKLSAEIGRIVSMPAIRETLSSQGADPFINDPAQFTGLIATDKARFDALITKANIKFGN